MIAACPPACAACGFAFVICRCMKNALTSIRASSRTYGMAAGNFFDPQSKADCDVGLLAIGCASLVRIGAPCWIGCLCASFSCAVVPDVASEHWRLTESISRFWWVATLKNRVLEVGRWLFNGM